MSQGTFNQTRMELKLTYMRSVALLGNTFNQTRMELKQI